jgi:hypothetical protein
VQRFLDAYAFNFFVKLRFLPAKKLFHKSVS